MTMSQGTPLQFWNSQNQQVGLPPHTEAEMLLEQYQAARLRNAPESHLASLRGAIDHLHGGKLNIPLTNIAAFLGVPVEHRADCPEIGEELHEEHTCPQWEAIYPGWEQATVEQRAAWARDLYEEPRAEDTVIAQDLSGCVIPRSQTANDPEKVKGFIQALKKETV